MWNKYVKSNEKERKILMAEFLTGLKIGCDVKTNIGHDNFFKTSFSGIVDDINLETGVVDVVIPIQHDRLIKIHNGWLVKVN